MKLKQLYIFVILLSVIGCSRQLTFDDAVGEYYQLDDYFNRPFRKVLHKPSGWALHNLRLNADSTYSYDWFACMPMYTTIGKWEVKENRLILHPYSDSIAEVKESYIDSIDGCVMVIKDWHDSAFFTDIVYCRNNFIDTTYSDLDGIVTINTTIRIDSFYIHNVFSHPFTYKVKDSSSNYFEIKLRPHQAPDHIVINKVHYKRDRIIIKHSRGRIRVKKK